MGLYVFLLIHLGFHLHFFRWLLLHYTSLARRTQLCGSRFRLLFTANLVAVVDVVVGGDGGASVVIVNAKSYEFHFRIYFFRFSLHSVFFPLVLLLVIAAQPIRYLTISAISRIQYTLSYTTSTDSWILRRKKKKKHRSSSSASAGFCLFVPWDLFLRGRIAKQILFPLIRVNLPLRLLHRLRSTHFFFFFFILYLALIQIML